MKAPQDYDLDDVSSPYAISGDFIIEPAVQMITVMNVSRKVRALQNNINTFIKQKDLGIIDFQDRTTLKRFSSIIKIISYSMYLDLCGKINSGLQIDGRQEALNFLSFNNMLNSMASYLNHTSMKDIKLSDEEMQKISYLVPQIKEVDKNIILKMVNFLALGIEVEGAIVHGIAA